MNINWKVRLQSLPFWTALFALVGFFLVQEGVIEVGKWDTVIQLILAVFTTAGIVVDPTTPGVADSARAQRYIKPGVEKPFTYKKY